MGSTPTFPTIPYSGRGAVVIYAGASGPGKPISNPQQTYYAWDGYDTSGNLWVDGSGYNGKFILSQCSASSCSTIPISGGTIYDAGFVQYAVREKTWYVADNMCGNARYREPFCIYPVSGSGVLGTPITLTDAQGHPVWMRQGVITNAKSGPLVGGAGSRSSFNLNRVARWSFPAGGPWTNDTSAAAWGAAISYK